VTYKASRIARVHARQILDSRGRPTVEAEVELVDGSFGRSCVPSGASTGRHEAIELRDHNTSQYDGLGVGQAVNNVRSEIADRLLGEDALDQRQIDRLLISLDGSANLSRLGANAVLATSMAVCRAAAVHSHNPLYRYINSLCRGRPMSLPLPMVNILSGGAHAGRGMDLQDFLAIPVGASSYSEALEMISRVRVSATRLLADRGYSVLLADEGGLSPGFKHAHEALDLMVQSFEAAGLVPGQDMAIAIDVAASELFVNGRYELVRHGFQFSGEEMASFITECVRRYPIISVEDALEQDDWLNWQTFTASVPGVQVIGDDLFVTNQKRITMGIECSAANGVLIKVNQNGTLSGTLDAMETAWRAGYTTVVSARSGETEDTFIADLAVGTGAGQIKIGSVRSSERLAKYNQLLRIEEDQSLEFIGAAGLGRNTRQNVACN